MSQVRRTAQNSDCKHGGASLSIGEDQTVAPVMSHQKRIMSTSLNTNGVLCVTLKELLGLVNLNVTYKLKRNRHLWRI